MRRRVRKPAQTPPAVVSATGRVVVARAVLGAALLAASSALADQQVLGVIDPADVLLGAALGLLAGPLALGERAARLGRPWAGLVWCAGLAVVGVLVAAVQAGFAARALEAGSAKGVHAAAYADAWLAALDPSTLRVVVARALPFALVPALSGRLGGGGLIAGVLVGGLILPWGVMSIAPPEHVPAVLLTGPGAAWALPTGARGTLQGPEDRATWLPGIAVVTSPVETAWLRPLVARVTALDALALALTALLADVLARGRRVVAPPPPSRWLPMARGVPTLAVAGLAALALLRHRPPPPFLVGPLVDQRGEPLREAMAWLLLSRLGPDDADVVPVLAAKLRDPSSARRKLAAHLLLRIGPPAALGALDELGRAVGDLDPEVQVAVLLAIEALGPDARPIASDVLRAMLASAGAPRRGWQGADAVEAGRRLVVLLDSWGYTPTDDELVAYFSESDDAVVAGALVILLRRGGIGPEHAPRLYDVARRGVAVDEAMETLATTLAPAGVALLRERLAAPDLDANDPILVLLERELPPGSHDVFALAARYPRSDVQERAARALDAQRPGGRQRGAVELLVELLASVDARTNGAARRSLRSHAAAAALPLAGVVEARGPAAASAAEVLGELGIHGAAAVPALVRALALGDPVLRLGAARALGRVGGGLEASPARDAALGALVAAVQHPDEQVAGMALEALRAFVGGDADAQVRDALVAALDAPSPAIRARAAMSLVHGGGATRTRGSPVLRTVEVNLPKIVPALVGGLDAPALRSDALQALSSLGARAREALPSICAVIRPGEDLGDALRAVAAIGLDPPGVLEAVARALRFARADDRLLALGLIRSQGPRAAEVLDDVAAALLDALPEVRRDAVLALAAVDLTTLARLRPALDARAAHEDDPQTAALLMNLLRRLDEAR